MIEFFWRENVVSFSRFLDFSLINSVTSCATLPCITIYTFDGLLRMIGTIKMTFGPILVPVMTNISDIATSEVVEMVWDVEKLETQEGNMTFSWKNSLKEWFV